MKPALHTVFLLATVIFTGCQPDKFKGRPVSQPVKPNILFILTDDQRADAMGCAGNTIVKTPTIDELSATGIRFTNCYIMGSHQAAVCAPSRAMLMSGKSLFHVYDNLEGVKTLPRYFAEHGYETFGTGKWHNTAETFISSFQRGKNIFTGGMSNHFRVPCYELDSDNEFTEVMEKGYSTDVFTEAVMEYLQEYSRGERSNPFFCYLAYTAPHDPRSPREDYTGMYREENIPLPENFMELHPFRLDEMNVRDETLAPWPRTPDKIKATLSDYYAMISHLDKRIGDIINLLKKAGIYDNTIIVFASDNGLAVGSHGLMGKQNLYEHSIKVPLIISGPGIPKGKEEDALVYLFDLFPTLSDLCGLPLPEEVDGKDLLPVMMGNEEEVRNSVYSAYRNTIRAVRTGDWKLIWNLQIKHIQLFNLHQDPYEFSNLAGNPDNRDRIIEMMKTAMEWYEATADTATLYPRETLPMEYDHTKLQQIPDQFQPLYVLKRFFPSQKDPLVN